MFEVDYKLTEFFFDRLAVQNRLEAKELRAMSRIGAFLMRGAQKSIKRRKSSSVPGSPPHAHSTDRVATLKNILFGYDPGSRSVVVGPVLLSRRRKRKAFFLERSKRMIRKSDARGIKELEGGIWIKDIEPSAPITVMNEFGGTARATIDDQPATLRFRARPTMGPTLERERKNSKLIQAWKDLM